MTLDAHTIGDVIAVVVFLVGLGVTWGSTKTRIGHLEREISDRSTALSVEMTRHSTAIEREVSEVRRTLDKFGERLGLHEKEDLLAFGGMKADLKVLEARLSRDEDSWEGVKRDQRDSERSVRQRRDTLTGREEG